jgi:hypothetical protein
VRCRLVLMKLLSTICSPLEKGSPGRDTEIPPCNCVPGTKDLSGSSSVWNCLTLTPTEQPPHCLPEVEQRLQSRSSSKQDQLLFYPASVNTVLP